MIIDGSNESSPVPFRVSRADALMARMDFDARVRAYLEEGWSPEPERHVEG